METGAFRRAANARSERMKALVIPKTIGMLTGSLNANTEI